MNLIPYKKNYGWSDPFKELERVQKELFQLFDRNLSTGIDRLDDTLSWQPVVDIDENDKEFTLTAELPGLEKNQIQVFVENGYVTLQGEKKYENKEKKKGFWRTERSFGKFKRIIELGHNIEENKVQASYKNGVLTVSIPKKPNPESKKIDINVD